MLCVFLFKFHLGGSMYKTFVFSILFLVLFSIFGYAQQTAKLTVEEMAICTSIEDRQPVGTDTAFVKTIGQLYCFVKVSGESDSTSISHVWFYDGKEMAKVELAVHGKTWRTWSSKRIVEEWVGNWKVEVTSSTGDVLMAKEFVVK